MIKIEFNEHNASAARAFAQALATIAEETEASRIREGYAPEEEPVCGKGLFVGSPIEETRIDARIEEILEEEAVPEVKSTMFAAEDTPVGIAADVEEVGSAQQTTTPAATLADVDTKGVSKDLAFCGNAAEPFYASGKRAGQWKKRKGVTDEAYDAWYAGQTPKAGPTSTVISALNTADAFAQTQPAAEPAPHDINTFMGWLAEQQAAGLLTQADIQSAYTGLGIQVANLFPPNSDADVANHVGAMHGLLCPIVETNRV